MTMPEVVGYLGGYAAAVDAPVETNTEVTSVRAARRRLRRHHDRGRVALPHRRAGQRGLRPARRPGGGRGAPDRRHVAGGRASTATPTSSSTAACSSSGASATGIQLADEIHRSGRPVTLAVGGHVRAPRTYRGMDIMWWLDAAGVLDERYDEVDDVIRVAEPAVVPARRLAQPGDAST